MQILCTSTKFKSCKKHNKKKPNIINERLKKTSSMEENFLKVKNDYESIMENADTKKNFTIKTLNKNLKILQNEKEKEI